MPIASSDIALRLSGGAANSVESASLGGAKSSVAAAAALFDTVSAAEAAAGDVEFRCVYVQNTHASLTLNGAVAWVSADTAGASSIIEIGVGTSTVNATEQSVANESTAPNGVTFAPAATKGAAIALGDIPAGQHRALWLRRTIAAGAAAANETYTIRIEGSTAA